MTTTRVTHIISGDLWAGAEVMAYNLIRELLIQPDLQLSVLLLNDGFLAGRLRGLSVDLAVIDEGQRSFPSMVTHARNWLHHRSPHVIHSHRYKENILAWLASDFGRKSQLLATQHGLPEKPAKGRYNRRQVIDALHQSLLRRRFGKVVGVSTSVHDFFLARHVPSQRLTVIHNGIDLPPSQREYRQREQLLVGSAGRLFPVKDYPLMIEVASHVASTAPAIRFSLAGDGPLRPDLERQICDNRLQTVFALSGHLDDIAAYHNKLDIYLNTSLHEGIPMSILEAMAHGLPVVAAAVGGINEIINHGVDGFLVNSRCPEAFAAQILQLQDATLRRRIGTAAREKIRTRFSAQFMARQYLGLYHELAGHQSRLPRLDG